MKHSNERGQVMVLVVFGIIALLAAAGLALDGGRLYQQRRQVQNAADAAALAGGRAFLDLRQQQCGRTVGVAEFDTAVRNAIIDYADQNGVTYGDPESDVKAWYVQAQSDGSVQDIQVVGALTSGDLGQITGVRVALTLTDTTTFMRIVGQPRIVTPADATAMVGPVISSPKVGPILPYAVPDETVYDMQPGDEFFVTSDGALCKQNDPAHCAQDATTAEANSQRGWLNFDYIYNIEHTDPSDSLYRTIKPSTNNARIAEFIDNPDLVPPIFPGTPPNPWPVREDDLADAEYYRDGDFIHGEPGEKAAMSSIYAAYAGETAYAPIFDLIYNAPYFENHPSTYPAPDGTWPDSFNKNTYLYHIVGFVALEVCDPDADPDCNKNEKELKGSFEKVILGQGEIDPTVPINCTLEFNAVVLWE